MPSLNGITTDIQTAFKERFGASLTLDAGIALEGDSDTVSASLTLHGLRPSGRSDILRPDLRNDGRVVFDSWTATDWSITIGRGLTATNHTQDDLREAMYLLVEDIVLWLVRQRFDVSDTAPLGVENVRVERNFEVEEYDAWMIMFSLDIIMEDTRDIAVPGPTRTINVKINDGAYRVTRRA